LQEEDLKEEKLSQLNFLMIKLESLKKNIHFKSVLKEKKVHTDFFSIFAAKNFISNKNKNILHISFVMKKKIGIAVKRNRIRRKLKAIVHKLLKIKGAINSNYTYIVFGKSKAYEKDHKILFSTMQKSFKKF
jgi:ribonuclease P protein component|tara:strand:+ start:1196 stop:1591 length:396 start_codon:yes stop_codon:yes gene_type:complete